MAQTPPNRYTIVANGILEVELSQGKWAVVDDTPKVREILANHRFYWQAGSLGGFARTVVPGSRKAVLLHSLIMGPTPEGHWICHINRNTLDNRRANLEFVTFSVCATGRQTRRDNTSGVTGVSRLRTTWGAYVQSDKKQVYKCFPDSRYGGSDGAFKAAVAWRLAMCKKTPQYVAAFGKDLINTTATAIGVVLPQTPVTIVIDDEPQAKKVKFEPVGVST